MKKSNPYLPRTISARLYDLMSDGMVRSMTQIRQAIGESERTLEGIFKSQSWLFESLSKKKYVMKEEIDDDRMERQRKNTARFEEMRNSSVSLLDQILEETKNGPAARELRRRNV